MESVAPEGPSLAAFLRHHRDGILVDWEARIRSLGPARGLSEEELLNHLPHLFDRIAVIVEDIEAGRESRGTGTLSDQHVLERLNEGFALDHVVREFAALRQCIFQLWSHEPQQSVGGPVLNEAIDEAVGTAVNRFTAARERTMGALDRIASAALSARSLDDLLQALTQVLLETTAAVDSVAIYLKQGNGLALHTVAGMERDPGGRVVSIEDPASTCIGRIAASGEPMELRHAARDPLAPEALRRVGGKAFYGVPMRHDGEFVGVASMASLTAWEFSLEDKLLFRSMVERATSGITQWQLHDALEVERRRLARSEARLRHVFESGIVGMMVWHHDHRIVEANDTLLRMLGYDRTDLAAGRLDWWELTAPESREVTSASVQRLHATGVTRYEKQFIRKDGSRLDTLVFGAELPNEAGLGIALLLDITEQKANERARDEALQREKAAREEAQQVAAMLDALFAGAPIGLAFFDRDLRYVRVNEVLAAFNERAVGEHLARLVRDIVPDQGEELEVLLRRVLEQNESTVGLEFSRPSLSKPDQPRDWQLNAYPVSLPDGTVLGVGGAVVDITALKQALRVRDDFLSAAAHDLRSPLTSVKLLAHNVHRAVERGPEHIDVEWLTRKLAKLNSQVDRVSALLDDLLDVSKLHSIGVQLELEEVDIAALVRDVAFRFGEILANAGCELTISARGPIVGRWDALRLEQVMSNLLSNAAKYGAGRPVEVRLTAEEDSAVVVVRDHGVGIAPELLGRIFNRFERVGDRKAFAGTGLGLWIVKQLVLAIGGTIAVESQPGSGTTFTVRLPRAGPPPA